MSGIQSMIGLSINVFSIVDMNDNYLQVAGVDFINDPVITDPDAP